MDDKPTFQHPQHQSEQPMVSQPTAPVPQVNQAVPQVVFNTGIIGLFETVSVAPTGVPLSPYDQIKIYNGNLYFYDSTNHQWDSAGNALAFANSLVNSSGTVSLVNDSTSPGNSYYYGTNSGGTKGFYSLPSGTPGGSSGQVQYNSSSTFAGSSNLTFDGTTVATYALTASQYLKLPVGTNLYP